MDKHRWARIREIFGHLADKTHSHRADYLEMVCEDDAELRREVEELLAAHDQLAATAAGADGSAAAPSAPGGTASRTRAPASGAPALRVAPGAQVGEYRLQALLGSGGMGQVYRAVHPRHGEVALKLLPRVTVQAESALARFRQEAKALAELRHPALCRLLDAFVTDELAGMAMEPVHGRELSQVIGSGPLPHAEGLRVLTTLAEALTAAHRRGIVHRDLKPANVMIGEDGRVRLLDFGIAKFADTRLTATGQILGTPGYMAPEQWRGEPLDARSDVWALGVLLYEMLTGERPFPGTDLATVAERVLRAQPPPLPTRSVDGVALEATGALLRRLLAKAPEARPSDAAAVLPLIRGLAADEDRGQKA
jgi:serine/threonine protein kinase